MPATLIFDLDGTLIDSAPGILATYAKILADANIAAAVPLDQSIIGPPLLPTLEKLTGSDEPARLQPLADRFKLDYDVTGVANTPSYADARQVLDTLNAAGHTLFLATNKRSSPTLALIKKYGWAHLFKRIYCIDSSSPAFIDKSAMLRQLLIDNLLPATECVYIGDTLGDLEAASACGIRFIAAQWGYGSWPPAPSSCYDTAHALKSLIGLLTEVKSAIHA